ncbi:(2Fe-2S)-binding protein [Fimbriimonas ginsengisoli]|uniref:BFD domain-containing protein (2Fe-2S)-binding domain-containing protein n=1 Tax=Fimbriimonas ginsengisoli Gsoil 348 TaxID=661478 RepID=A0A068NX55_FIMGI|nr:(2Fe-2S)-binding protein [Fimbriimonas ginsengisoli]AIE88016.1 BFD domain-containing protein (2Fe-2S)-binding domain-containing protein [Fimbriimonas ginsengisoli Gsoil 348]
MSEDDRPVRKCVCFDIPFATLKAAGVQTVEEAAERFGCGTNCGLCRPYIAKMLRTGDVAFAVDNPPPGATGEGG